MKTDYYPLKFIGERYILVNNDCIARSIAKITGETVDNRSIP